MVLNRSIRVNIVRFRSIRVNIVRFRSIRVNIVRLGSTFLLRNDTDELIELATAKKTRDQQREKFRQINHKIATLKYSGGVLQ